MYAYNPEFKTVTRKLVSRKTLINSVQLISVSTQTPRIGWDLIVLPRSAVNPPFPSIHDRESLSLASLLFPMTPHLRLHKSFQIPHTIDTPVPCGVKTGRSTRQPTPLTRTSAGRVGESVKNQRSTHRGKRVILNHSKSIRFTANPDNGGTPLHWDTFADRQATGTCLREGQQER